MLKNIFFYLVVLCVTLSTQTTQGMHVKMMQKNAAKNKLIMHKNYQPHKLTDISENSNEDDDSKNDPDALLPYAEKAQNTTAEENTYYSLDLHEPNAEQSELIKFNDIIERIQQSTKTQNNPKE